MFKFFGQNGYWKNGYKVFPTFEDAYDNFAFFNFEGGFIKFIARIIFYGVLFGALRDCAGCNEDANTQSTQETPKTTMVYETIFQDIA